MRMVLCQAALRFAAHCLLLAGRREVALVCFGRMVQRQPRHRHALASRAQLLMDMGQSAAALDALRQLTAWHSHDAIAWFNLGFVLEASGVWAEAGGAFARAIELAPSLDRAWYGLALIRIRERRWDEAILALERNTQLQPMNPCGWYQLARVHADQRAPREARRIVEHLRTFEPKVAARLDCEIGMRLHDSCA